MPQVLAVSIKDAAIALSLSPWTIRRWISDGKLPFVRLGRRVLIEPSAIEKLLAEGRTRHVS
jgi:excisionase family DNA binding protein